MTTNKGDVQLLAGRDDLLEDGLRLFGYGAFWQQYRSQEPPGGRPHAGHVVGVDLDGVPPDEVGGKGDGIGLGHQHLFTHLDDRGVLPYTGA